MPDTKTTVVLVHGAWAECASWNYVLPRLQKTGLGAVCAPIPLTNLSDDVGALERSLARIEGDIVLVGHAYAGAVIAATKNQRVKLLIYGKDRPSWFLVAENDRMISAKTQHFEAARMRATIRARAVDHSPMLTSPQWVVEVIHEAVRATLPRRGL